MPGLHRPFMWVVVGALGMGLGACRKAPTNAEMEMSREATGVVRSAPEGAAVIATAHETRTPEEWLARVLETGAITDAAERTQALATLLAGMGDEARAWLSEALWALGEERGARACFDEFFALWCETDPETAGKWAVTMWDEIPGRPGEALREQAGFAWATRDFASAFAWALGLRDVTSEWGLAAKLLKQMARHDPQRALELARGVSDEFYAAALNRIFAGWVELDPATAFAELGLACRNSSMFPHGLGKWADRDPVAATRWTIENKSDWIHSLAGFVQDKGAFVTALYDAKIDWAETQYGRRSLLPDFFNSWVGADEARALVWLDTLPDGAEKTALLEAGAGYRAYGPNNKLIPSAAPLIARLPDAERRRELAGRLLAEWGRSDPEAALKWSLELDDPVLHEAALVSAVAGLAKLDVAAARAQLEALPVGAARDQATLNLALGWSDQAGVEAFRWLNETKPDWAAASWREDDQTGRVTLLSNAMAADPAAVAEWANALPDRTPVQFLVGNAALQLGNQADGGQKRKAARALEALKPTTRGMYLEPARYMILFGDQAAEARAYVERSTIFTPEEKAVLLKP